MAVIVSLPPQRAIAVAAPRAPAAVAPASRPTTGAAVAIVLPAKGFGYARYVQAASDPVVVLSAGVKTRLLMTVDPGASRLALRPPFLGQTLWDGALLKAVHQDDVIDLRLNLTVTGLVAGGSLAVEADIVGGPPALQLSQALPSQAGQIQTLSFSSFIAASASLLATNGAQLFLTSTVPVQVGASILLLAPQDSGS